MKEYISLDAHKQYSLAGREDKATGKERHCRIEHRQGAIANYLSDVEAGTPVAVEATGNWYWIVDEIESSGCVPQLVHPQKAKVMYGCINKTDKLDVRGMNRLQRVGTLPTVWIAPAGVRDLRELPRTRMFLSRQSTQLKNRIQANLTKHGWNVKGYSDPFGVKARVQMRRNIAKLPLWTRQMTISLLDQFEELETRLRQLEKMIIEMVRDTPDMQLLRTLPGVGFILAVVISMEVGDVRRFYSAERLASYSGTTPRIHSSGGKTRFGRLRPDVNRALKYAFMEAANCVVLHSRHYPMRHVNVLYRRIKHRKGHQKAVGAVARHLAEAAFHVLSRKENYKEPDPTKSRVRNKGNASATAA